MMNTTILTRGALGAILLSVAFLPASAHGQAPGWTAWIGCWEGEGAPEGSALCVRPSEGEPGAVEILGVADGQLQDREVVWADGERHPTVREGCEGWEEGRFSRDGRRVFLRSSHTCEEGVAQEAGGIMAMATPDVWLDVRYMEVGDEPTAWVQRYRPAALEIWETAGMAELAPQRVGRIRASRLAAAEAPDVDDVIEASAALPAEAVEAWIAEKGDPFSLDADQLVRLADAGVADRVIDVVVAVSNPDVFALGNGQAPERVDPETRSRRGYAGYGAFHPRRPFGSSLYFRYGYAPYGYSWSPFGYGSWGYGGWGGYGGYGYRPTVIVVDRKDDDFGRRPSRVIAGQGYRGPRTGGDSGSGSGSTVRPSGASQGSSSASPSPRPASRPEPRKAKPRRPGGGNDDNGGGDPLL